MIIIIGLPILVTLILFNSVYSPNGFRPIPVAIVDQDKSDFSRVIIERLKKEKSIKLLETTKDDAEKKVASNMLEAAFVIMPGFKEKIKTENASEVIKVIKNPASISSEMIGETIAGTTMRLLCSAAASNIVVKEYQSLSYDLGKSSQEVWDKAWKHTDNQWNQPEPLMKVELIDINGNTEDGSAHFVQNYRILWGVMAAFLMFFLSVGAWWMADEKRNGTLARMLCSTVSPMTIVMGNMIFLFLVGIFQAVVMMAVIKFIFGIDQIPLLPVSVVIASYILFLASFVITVSLYMSPIQLNFFIPVFSLFTAIIGGSFWNIDILSDKITNLSLITPQGWAIKALNSVTMEGSKLDFMLWVMLGFSIFSIILMYVSYKKIKSYA